ncbi:hypothetical protein LCGC14_1355160, partial [marine sediment metagenome]
MNVTEEEKELQKEIVSDQAKQAMWIYEAINKNKHTGNLLCVCRRRVPIWQMYHCYHCGLWLCEKCS